MFWTITNEDLLTAQAGNTDALSRLFGQAMPPCVLIATSLLGRRDAANQAARELVRRAAAQIPNWRDAEEAARWFIHHTIRLSREYRKPLDAANDVLLKDIGGPDVAQYQAMILALRKLSEQQQEAFILTYGQKWNVRFCAVAMDCSTTAVETHLGEATRQIQPLVGKNFGPLTGFLHQVHRSLPIDTPAPPGMIASRIKARRGFRMVLRLLGWLLILGLVGAIGYFVVIIWPHIET